MKMLSPPLLIAAALAVAGTARAVDLKIADFKATSSVSITRGSDGGFAARVKNTRFIPYLTLDEQGVSHFRLVTVATNEELRTDREPADPTALVSVTVDDMAGDKPKRLAAFQDLGADGVVAADRYFATTQPGCCGGADSHHVRLLESGKHLFQSTGPGPVGISAWASFPNARPEQIRWAAFAGIDDEALYKAGVLGTLTYGNETGPLTTLQVVRPKPPAENDDLDLALANGAALLWIDSKEKVPPVDPTLANAGPAAGSPDSPKDIWSLEKVTAPADITGMVLALELDGKRLISIPVEQDKLVPSKATIDPTLVLKPAP
ncbi:MAG TPA: hypothetical protein VM639_22735 [Dongiaceae bacterium]|nr:hypothetical protein [Dongiaceae bacterium]